MVMVLLGAIESTTVGFGDSSEHCIKTRFFFFVVPVETLCVTQSKLDLVPGGTRQTSAGERVRMSLKSVALGYARAWLGFLILAAPFISARVRNDHSAFTWSQLTPSLYALIAFVLVGIVPGRLEREKRRQLLVLRKVTGLGCDPERRFPRLRDPEAERLLQCLAQEGLPTEAEGLAARVPSLSPAQLAVAFAAAWYQKASGKAEWGGPMNAAWDRLRDTWPKDSVVAALPPG